MLDETAEEASIRCQLGARTGYIRGTSIFAGVGTAIAVGEAVRARSPTTFGWVVGTFCALLASGTVPASPRPFRCVLVRIVRVRVIVMINLIIITENHVRW